MSQAQEPAASQHQSQNPVVSAVSGPLIMIMFCCCWRPQQQGSSSRGSSGGGAETRAPGPAAQKRALFRR